MRLLRGAAAAGAPAALIWHIRLMSHRQLIKNFLYGANIVVGRQASSPPTPYDVQWIWKKSERFSPRSPSKPVIILCVLCVCVTYNELRDTQSKKKKENIISNPSSGDGSRGTFARTFRRWQWRNNDIATDLTDVLFLVVGFSCFFFCGFRLFSSEQAGNWAEIDACRTYRHRTYITLFKWLRTQCCCFSMFHEISHSTSFFFCFVSFTNEIDCSNEIEPKFILSHANIHMFRAFTFVEQWGESDEWNVFILLLRLKNK